MSIVCDLSEFAGPKKDRKEPDPVATADEAPPVARTLTDGSTQLERELDELRKARTYWRERAEAAERRAEAAEGDVKRLDWLDNQNNSYNDVVHQIRQAQGKITTYRAAIDAAIAAGEGK